ncbi:MAG: hypothetical protein V5A43_11810 [Haloarculaceae archaeon]
MAPERFDPSVPLGLQVADHEAFDSIV